MVTPTVTLTITLIDTNIYRYTEGYTDSYTDPYTDGYTNRYTDGYTIDITKYKLFRNTGTTGGTRAKEVYIASGIATGQRRLEFPRTHANTSDTPHRRLQEKAHKLRSQYAHEAFSVLYHAWLQQLRYSNKKNGGQP